MNSVKVYDDEGVLYSTSFQGFESNQEASLSIVDSLIEWTEQEGDEHYYQDDLDEHVDELNALKAAIKSGEHDVTSGDWYETKLGFTFSAFNEEQLAA